MDWKKWQTIAALIVAMIVIGTSGWKFFECKASKSSVIELAANFDIYKLEQYRRYMNQRIWDIKREYPNQYQNMREYHRLIEELRQIDMKINAFYQKKGK